MKADDTALATIVSLDPMCVAFDVPRRHDLSELRRNPPHLQGGPALPVLVGLKDENGYPRKSKVESAAACSSAEAKSAACGP